MTRVAAAPFLAAPRLTVAVPPGRRGAPAVQGEPVPAVRDDVLAALFASHAGPLTRLAGLLTGDRSVAEDVVQDAFAGLHRRWSTLRDPELALAYLRTSVVNGSRSRLRRRRSERERDVQHVPDAASAESDALRNAERAAVRTALAGLPRRLREVLVLRYHLELSEADIAATLGISRGAVKGYSSRGLVRLGEALRAAGEGR